MRQRWRGFVGRTAIGAAFSALVAAGCSSSGNSSAAAQAAATEAKAAANTISTSFAQVHPGARVLAVRPYQPTREWIVAYRNPDGTIGYAAYDAKGRPAVMPAAVASSLPKQ